ncbi:MAG: hypothetical protein Aurels2KO_29550 [Aureliella sp.]
MKNYPETTNGDHTAVFVPPHPSSTQAPRIGAIVNERFRLMKELGSGGMAVVYLAEEIETQRQVAVKMMNQRIAGGSTRRFTREFSTIASIDHEHCLRVFEYGESELGPFFAMELFEAAPLTVLTAESLEVKLRALYDLAAAVDFVHQRRIIHRDIKPGNMLVRRRKNSAMFEVRLADFGLAKFANVSSSLSEETDFMGTIAYCAPEQIMREELDQRADIYAFGITAYELLAGSHPFASARSDVQAMISAHLRTQPDDIRTFCPELDSKFANCLKQMVEKEPAGRPGTLAPLRSAIGRALGLTDESLPTEPQKSGQPLRVSFVGRDSERQHIERLVTQSISPNSSTLTSWRATPIPSIVFVTGDAGIGKTSLMRQAARVSAIEGAKIYEARCFEGNQSSFQPIVEIVRQLLVEQNVRRFSNDTDDNNLATTTMAQTGDPTQRVSKILNDYAPELKRVGPELRNLLPGTTFAPAMLAQESDYIYRAIASFFVELGRVQATSILVDDLQWADNATLTLLKHFSASIVEDRRLAAEKGGVPTRLFLMATSRSGESYSSAEKFVSSVTSGEAVALHGFNSSDTRELIASAAGCLTHEITDEITTFTERLCLGNPFYITASVKEWLASGQLRRVNEAWILEDQDDSAVSNTVFDGIKARLAALPESSEWVLHVAALIGKHVSLSLLESVVKFDDDFVFLDAIDDLFSRNLMQESQTPHNIEFGHDLIREVALRVISKNRERGWHRRIAEALRKRLENGGSVPLPKLANHYLKAGDGERARELLVQAGEASVKAFASADAIHQLEQALKISPEDITAGQRFKALLLLGKAYNSGSEIDKAIQALGEAYAITDTPLERATACNAISECHSRRRDYELAAAEGIRGLEYCGYKIHNHPIGIAWDLSFCYSLAVLPTRVQRLLIRAEPSESTELIARLLPTTGAAYQNSDMLRYMQVCGNILIAANRCGRDFEMARCYGKFALNMGIVGNIWLGNRFSKVANFHATRSKDPYINAYVRGLQGMITFCSGELRQAEAELLDGLERFSRLGDSYYRLGTQHTLRHVYQMTGEIDLEIQAAETELSMATRSGDWEAMAWGAYGLADAHARQGNMKEAHTWIKKSIERYETRSSIMSEPICHVTEAFVLVQDSQYDAAASVLKSTYEKAERDYMFLDYNVSAYPQSIEAILGADWHKQHSEALKLVPTSLRIRNRMVGANYPNQTRAVLRARGRYAAAAGKLQKSVGLFTKCIELSRKQGASYEEARGLLDRSLVSKNTALEDRESGFAILKRLGATIPAAELKNLET